MPRPKTTVLDKLPQADGGTQILVMPLDVELYELGAGGFLEPKAEWSAAAREYLTTAFRDAYAARSIRTLELDESKVPSAIADDVHQLIKLHGAVGNAMLIHEYAPPGKLPAKEGRFDWSLGPSANILHTTFGADYALFVYVRDSYSSGGRVAVQIVGALLGVGIQGGIQTGFASLVDLRTGNVVWFNRIIRGTGDLRNAAAAKETTGVLLAGFPQ
jgi:hypothetical protein